ncbi:hypothetical protein L1987_60822 [Smallanthus sonchifolius]|uniref:Uncharacterized protein n=1 Tax=Smallanthus sonchifolius TaxID=185202 RepID=A0ACB9D934_9ASTR|nr:hypothetical protein L1987_60822 [Smallanthus sonchifolius]
MDDGRCGPDPIEDDFFSDDDEAEVEESSDDTVGDDPGNYSQPDLIEYNCDNLELFNFPGDEPDSSNARDTLRLLFENNLMQDIENEDECCEEGLTGLCEKEDESEDQPGDPLDELEEEQVPSWESEFGDELGACRLLVKKVSNYLAI